MSFNIRLNKIQLWTGLNPTQFGDSLKHTHTENVRVLLKAKDSNPGLKVIKDILETYPQVDARWLITGEGTMLKKETDIDVVSEPKSEYAILLDRYEVKTEECGALKRELDIVKRENEILRAGGSDQGQDTAEARAG